MYLFKILCTINIYTYNYYQITLENVHKCKSAVLKCCLQVGSKVHKMLFSAEG